MLAARVELKNRTKKTWGNARQMLKVPDDLIQRGGADQARQPLTKTPFPHNIKTSVGACLRE
jgi:hypothetical protein